MHNVILKSDKIREFRRILRINFIIKMEFN